MLRLGLRWRILSFSVFLSWELSVGFATAIYARRGVGIGRMPDVRAFKFQLHPRHVVKVHDCGSGRRARHSAR